MSLLKLAYRNLGLAKSKSLRRATNPCHIRKWGEMARSSAPMTVVLAAVCWLARVQPTLSFCAAPGLHAREQRLSVASCRYGKVHCPPARGDAGAQGKANAFLNLAFLSLQCRPSHPVCRASLLPTNVRLREESRLRLEPRRCRAGNPAESIASRWCQHDAFSRSNNVFANAVSLHLSSAHQGGCFDSAGGLARVYRRSHWYACRTHTPCSVLTRHIAPAAAAGSCRVCASVGT